MRFHYVTYDERVRRRGQWHRWFAWYPVKVSPGEGCWLEVVERRGWVVPSWDETYWSWEYRDRDAG